MAGGTWTSQNKVLPGVYINVKSQGNLSPSIGDRGVVAICEPLSWGPAGTIQEYIPGEDPTPYIGYDLTQPEANFLMQMLQGSDVTSGPTKVLLYRPVGTGGAAATATIGALTVTALYPGVRGNDITVVVQGDPDSIPEEEEDPTVYDVSTYVSGYLRDEQSVSNLSELVDNGWVKFSGTGATFTATAGTPLTGGTDPTVGTTDYAAFLQVLDPYKFDVLIYDGSESTVIQAYAQFVERISNNVGQKCQAVMANAQASNSEFVISPINGVELSDGTVLTPQQVCWWLGGVEAGAIYNQSLTYAQYPYSVAASPKLSETEQIAAIQAGNIVFMDNFGVAQVVSDINTLTSFTVDKGKEFSKNRVMRVVMQFCNDAYEAFSLYYIGKTHNNDEGRDLLKGWICGYFNEMQANGGVQNFDPEDIEVSQGNDIDSVVIKAAIQPVDSIEKIYITLTVSATTQTE